MSRVCATIFLFALFSICDGQADKPQINEPGFTCTAGRLFTYDCNTCTCDDSGTLARCTAMACPPEERSKRSDPEEACTPGEMKMKVCNRCRCTDSRIWACTRKFCTDAIVEVEDMNNDNHQQKLKRSVDEEASTAEPMVEKCKTGDKKINVQ